MRTLLVLRHAKSSWRDPALDDHDRPLNDRGERDAPRIGRLLREVDCIPDAIVSSTAARARSTAEAVAGACGFEGLLHFESALYLAEPATYLEFVAALGAEFDRVMLVGHNPGIEELVQYLTGRDERMPTAALARIALPLDAWSDLGRGVRGELLDLWRPKELGNRGGA